MAKHCFLYEYIYYGPLDMSSGFYEESIVAFMKGTNSINSLSEAIMAYNCWRFVSDGNRFVSWKNDDFVFFMKKSKKLKKDVVTYILTRNFSI